MDAPLGIGYARFLDISRRDYGVALNTHNDWVRVFVEGGLVLGVLIVLLVASRLLAPTTGHVDGGRLKVILAVGCVAFAFSNTMADLRVSAPAFISAGLIWGMRRRPAPGGGQATDLSAAARSVSRR